MRTIAKRLWSIARFCVDVFRGAATGFLLILMAAAFGGMAIAAIDWSALEHRYLRAAHAVKRFIGSNHKDEPLRRTAFQEKRIVGQLIITTQSNEWPGVIGQRWCVVRRAAGLQEGPAQVVGFSRQLFDLTQVEWPFPDEARAQALGVTIGALIDATRQHCVLQ